ncbi:hypothetical protein [Streptomyces sp. NPDC059479]|uniref:hypothetical protein n=1 Tax=Streptomyces sp. NPDC059479 TaxID=3346848 RepID=UPI0036B7B054
MSTAAHHPPGKATVPPQLARQLTAWAKGHIPNQAGVAALLEEGTLLAREDIQKILLRGTGPDQFCYWTGLERQLFHVRKTASEHAFLQLVISLASPYTVHIGQALRNLDEHHQSVIFKAMRR